MRSHMSRFQEGPDRKRRAHAKSRKGCGNCKLRRVKCDETRPQCKKCLSYGVSCNYDGKQATLDLTAQGSFQVDFQVNLNQTPEKDVYPSFAPRVAPVSINQSMVNMLQNTLEAESMPEFGHWHRMAYWTYSEKDLEILQRFNQRTVMTIGTKRGAPVYRDRICPMAFTYPFLMHMILSLTLMHDAFLASDNPEISAKHTHASLQHWNTATVLFNKVLSRPIEPQSRDALWATAALIGSNVFAYVEATDVEESWPLKPSDPNDLDWLKLSEGKKAVWKIAEPNRPDSVFNEIAKEHNYTVVPMWVKENDLSRIPVDAKRLFSIDETSTVRSNPYHLPLLILSRLQDMTPTHDNVLSFLYFLGYMTAEFRNLLEVKDARALLLLGWWFKKLEYSELWWLKKRANIEGKGIQIWLERWYGGEKGLSQMFDAMGQCAPRIDGGGDPWHPLTGWFYQGDIDRLRCQMV